MTIERRIVISLRDIRAVIFECKCGARSTQPFDTGIALPETCPRNHRWDMKSGPAVTYAPEVKFTKMLEELIKQAEIGPSGFRVLLELNDPNAPDASSASASA